MKKLLLSSLLLGAFAWGCDNKNNSQEMPATNTSEIQDSLMTETTDSLTLVIEKEKEEIESSAQKLDNALNAL